MTRDLYEIGEVSVVPIAAVRLSPLGVDPGNWAATGAFRSPAVIEGRV
jgi:hypothetical protein